jgi:hypothetical protein
MSACKEKVKKTVDLPSETMQTRSEGILSLKHGGGGGQHLKFLLRGNIFQK